MPIFATCASLAVVLARADGGETIALQGNCPTITISRSFARPVTIDAAKARVSGLVLTGANIRWRGGTIWAPGGMDAKGPAGYAVLIRGARGIHFERAVVTGAKKGMVIDRSRAVTVDRVEFTRLREDGIIASQTAGLTVASSSFADFLPRPSRCTSPAGVVATAVARRDCRGVWIDGNHADAVQLRDGVSDARIADNTVRGPTQGITQMDTRGDAPLARVVVENNRIETSAYHQITLTECADCSIRRNIVRRERGWDKRAVIRPGKARRCGNDTQDEARDQACRKEELLRPLSDITGRVTLSGRVKFTSEAATAAGPAAAVAQSRPRLQPALSQAWSHQCSSQLPAVRFLP